MMLDNTYTINFTRNHINCIVLASFPSSFRSAHQPSDCMASQTFYRQLLGFLHVIDVCLCLFTV